MSEVLRDLHMHDFFGFDQETFNLHQVHSMSTPVAVGTKSSKKGPKKLAPLEDVMKGHVIYKNFGCHSTSWEVDELHSTSTCTHQLEKIVTIAKIKPSSSEVYHRLPRDEEMPNHNYDDFGAWS
uniref:Uncharacterized protein n=1 Tax=Cannabis sativa TaxID=3483 RepID=A0A803QJB8_CANSA